MGLFKWHKRASDTLLLTPKPPKIIIFCPFCLKILNIFEVTIILGQKIKILFADCPLKFSF